jgi:hypothetical protein
MNIDGLDALAIGEGAPASFLDKRTAGDHYMHGLAPKPSMRFLWNSSIMKWN